MRNNKKWKALAILVFAVAGMFSFSLTASADFGPHDQLTIHVKNPPNELYYLDLLAQNTGTYDNFSNGERKNLDQHMLTLLYSYQDKSWKPVLVQGTGSPIFGDLVGKQNGNEMIHTFGYNGLPQTYRIIIVTKSGKVSVSGVYSRKALQSSIAYDYSTGKTSIPPMWLCYLVQFATTCIPTLLIEGILLLLYGFKFKENYKIFLLVNLTTQIILTLILGTALIKGGYIHAYLMQFPVELVILVAETILFVKFLKGKSKAHKISYGITANIASWAIGFFLIMYQFDLISHLL